MLITFYGSVPIFKEAEPIKNLYTAHGLLVKGSLRHFVLLVPIFLSFMQKFSYRHCCVLLGMTNTIHDTNTLLAMKGCCEVLLIEDMQERIQTHPVTMQCKVLQQ